MQTKIGEMTVAVYDSNAALGQAAAQDFAAIIRQAVKERGEVSVIFATGNSQLTFMRSMHEFDIPWDRLTAFVSAIMGLDVIYPGGRQKRPGGIGALHGAAQGTSSRRLRAGRRRKRASRLQ